MSNHKNENKNNMENLMKGEDQEKQTKLIQECEEIEEN